MLTVKFIAWTGEVINVTLVDCDCVEEDSAMVYLINYGETSKRETALGKFSTAYVMNSAGKTVHTIHGSQLEPPEPA